jgi:hypothetical protein
MATLTTKEKLPKITFDIPSDLKEKHSELIALARDLDIMVDFTPDFLKWFMKDLKTAKKKLLEIKTQQEEKR